MNTVRYLVGFAATVAIAMPTAAHARDLLPDLVQERPRDISVAVINGRARLGFRSAVHNAGDGPLIVIGRRSSTQVRDMTAHQLVRTSDRTFRYVAKVGLLRYVNSPDHSHWHYRPFERYLLRTLDGRNVGRDTKTGFCLGDRYPVAQVSRPVDVPVYVGLCGIGRPNARSIRQGISVGWGDDYAAYLEGQSIDVTGLPLGRYRLIHRADGAGRLLELSRANNSASVIIELFRSSGRLRVRVIS